MPVMLKVDNAKEPLVLLPKQMLVPVLLHVQAQVLYLWMLLRKWTLSKMVSIKGIIHHQMKLEWKRENLNTPIGIHNANMSVGCVKLKRSFVEVIIYRRTLIMYTA